MHPQDTLKNTESNTMMNKAHTIPGIASGRNVSQVVSKQSWHSEAEGASATHISIHESKAYGKSEKMRPCRKAWPVGGRKQPTGLRTWAVGIMLAWQEFDPQNLG